MLKRSVRRHKNCGGFILPDLENSFNGMNYGYCPKCNKNKLTIEDCDIAEEKITLYIIRNKSTGEYLLVDNDGDLSTITFESKEQADKFAKDHGLSNYEIEPNVALYCTDAPVTNGKMIIEKQEVN